MSQIKRFKAKKGFKLDCGHDVKPGDSFVVTKTFSCDADASRLGYAKPTAPPPQK